MVNYGVVVSWVDEGIYIGVGMVNYVMITGVGGRVNGVLWGAVSVRRIVCLCDIVSVIE